MAWNEIESARTRQGYDEYEGRQHKIRGSFETGSRHACCLSIILTTGLLVSDIWSLTLAVPLVLFSLWMPIVLLKAVPEIKAYYPSEMKLWVWHHLIAHTASVALTLFYLGVVLKMKYLF